MGCGRSRRVYVRRPAVLRLLPRGFLKRCFLQIFYFSMVRGTEHGRSGLGPLDLLQEPRPFFSDRSGQIVFKFILYQAEEAKLLSEDHFSVDGTLIEAWASMKSVRPKDQSQDDPPAARGATKRWISEARSAGTRPTVRPPIPRPKCFARERVRRPNFASWATH